MTAILPYAVMIVLLVIIAWCGLAGFLKKLKKTIGATICIILSAIASLIITSMICSGTLGFGQVIVDKITDMLSSTALADVLGLESFATASGYYVTMLLAPIVFTLLFFVIRLILNIVVGIIIRFIPLLNHLPKLADRLGGLGLGMVNGFVVALMLLMPLLGTVRMVNSVAKQADVLMDEGTENKVVEYTDPLVNAGTGKVVLDLGGKALYSKTSTMKYEGCDITLENELVNLIDVANCVKLLTEDVETYGSRQVDAFQKSADDLEKSRLLASLTSEILSTASNNWLEGKKFLGIERINGGEMLDRTITSVLKVFSTSNADNISEDLHTVADVFGVLAKNEVFQHTDNSGEILSILSKKGVVSGVVSIIEHNDRMTPITAEITDLSVRSLASVLGVPEGEDEEYDNLMNNIADIMNVPDGEDKHSAVREGVVSALDNYGVKVDGEAADEITNSLIKDLGDKEDLSGDDVKAFFAMYALENSEEFEGYLDN